MLKPRSKAVKKDATALWEKAKYNLCTANRDEIRIEKLAGGSIQSNDVRQLWQELNIITDVKLKSGGISNDIASLPDELNVFDPPFELANKSRAGCVPPSLTVPSILVMASQICFHADKLLESS